jgi:hypothetical protein
VLSLVGPGTSLVVVLAGLVAMALTLVATRGVRP